MKKETKITIEKLMEAIKLLEENTGNCYDLIILENNEAGIEPGWYKFINGEYVLQKDTET